MTDRKIRTIQITSGAAGLLLATGFIFLLIGKDGGPAWANLLSGLAFSALLSMPALLLILRRNLAALWVNALLHIVTWRPPHERIGHTQTPEWEMWSRMSDVEKVSVCFLAGLCLLAGGLILAGTLSQFLSVPH